MDGSFSKNQNDGVARKPTRTDGSADSHAKSGMRRLAAIRVTTIV